MSDFWYGQYQGWTGVSDTMYSIGTDAWLAGDTYDAYLWNAGSVEASMVADTAWDNYTSYDTSSSYDYSSYDSSSYSSSYDSSSYSSSYDSSYE